MDPLIESFNIFTFCVCTFILILQIRIKLKRNNFSISEFVSLIFYFFYVLPILYDLLLGIPDYSVYDFIRFTKASHDIMSVIIYDLMVILIQFLFYYKFIRPINSYSITLYSNFKSYIYILLYILIYLPILLFFFFPNKEIFYIYSTLGQNRITESTDLYMLIHNSTVLSILALFIFMVLKNNGLYIYRFLPILFIDIWLNGKRFIVIIVEIGRAHV